MINMKKLLKKKSKRKTNLLRLCKIKLLNIRKLRLPSRKPRLRLRLFA